MQHFTKKYENDNQIPDQKIEWVHHYHRASNAGAAEKHLYSIKGWNKFNVMLHRLNQQLSYLTRNLNQFKLSVSILRCENYWLTGRVSYDNCWCKLQFSNMHFTPHFQSKFNNMSIRVSETQGKNERNYLFITTINTRTRNLAQSDLFFLPFTLLNNFIIRNVTHNGTQNFSSFQFQDRFFISSPIFCPQKFPRTWGLSLWCSRDPKHLRSSKKYFTLFWVNTN